jgi:hypothetical protein
MACVIDRGVLFWNPTTLTQTSRIHPSKLLSLCGVHQFLAGASTHASNDCYNFSTNEGGLTELYVVVSVKMEQG